MRTKLLVGLLVLFCAIAISATAAYFSVVGLAALFAAAFLPVCIMGSILEGSKLVAAGWLHSNWKNKNVSKAHKGYLAAAVLTLMMITSMGCYGFLMRAHLEQGAPTAAIQVDLDQKQATLDQLTVQRDQLLTQQKAINDTVAGYLSNGKATGASSFIRQQKSQQEKLQKQITDLNNQITQANVAMAPLKKQVAGSQVELGQWKYLAKALHMKDPESAIDLLIKMIIFAFDPLAVVLMISATITLGEWQQARRELPTSDVEEDEPVQDDPDSSEELPIPEPISEEPQEAPEMPVEPAPEAEATPAPESMDTPYVIFPPKPSAVGTLTEEDRARFSWDKLDPIVSEADAEPSTDPKEQLINILENRPELLEEIARAVEEVQAEHAKKEAEEIVPEAPASPQILTPEILSPPKQ